METIRDFEPADRYVYDFGPCTTGKGFAQVDTGQDASYFGTWADPFRLVIVNYCEGDVTIQIAENAQEFITELRENNEWNIKNGLNQYLIMLSIYGPTRWKIVLMVRTVTGSTIGVNCGCIENGQTWEN